MAKTNCFNLLNGSNEAFYWTGFILADGCVSLDSSKKKDKSLGLHRLSIVLNKIDFEHLQKYQTFLQSGQVYTYNNRVSIITYDGTKEFMDYYKINFRKTYNPCDFEYFKQFSKEQLLSLLAGIIDGDGSITYKHNKKSVFIRIAAHGCWENFYRSFMEYLKIPYTIVRCSKVNAISVNIQNKKLIYLLYNNLKALKLPLLSRKWERIDKIPMNLTTKKKVHQFDLEGNFVKEFESVQQAGEELGIDNTGISKCLKGHLKKSGGYVWKYANP